MEWAGHAWIAIAAAGVAFFLDAPFLTWRQRFVAQRSRARRVLVLVELNLVVSWAIAGHVLGWDAPLAPGAAEAPAAAAGLALTGAGVVLAVWAKRRLGRWFSATFAVKEGHVLVTDGPYGVTRHPIYTGVLAAALGAALVWNSLATLALAVLLAAPLFVHTVYEEALFERHFGDAYREYQARVPRLFPLPRP